MLRSRLSGLWWLCVFLSASALVQAQTTDQAVPGAQQFPVPIDLSVARSLALPDSRSLFGMGSITVLQDAPSALTIEQVAALPAGAFSLFDVGKSYPLTDKRSLWLHFRAVGPAPSPTVNWTLELPKPFVDKVELYHRNAQGGWEQQQSGEWLPQARWAVRGMHARFYLPELAPGSNDFYIRVSQLVPLRFNVTLKTSEAASFDYQNALLVNALVLSLMLFVALFAFVLSLVYRVQIYAWYAIYVVFAFLAVASYVGLGYYAFWPTLSDWAEVSHTIFLMLALAAQLQFCVALLLSPRSWPRVRPALSASAAVLACASVAVVLVPLNAIYWRVGISLGIVLVSALLILAVAVAAAFKRRAIAWVWIVAYMPVLAFIGLTLVEQFGLAPLPWLPYSGVVLAAGFEVLVLLVALHLHVKEGHADAVRRYTLADVDPLTGFVAPRQFPAVLAEAWANARQRRRDLSVVYVRANFKAGPLRRAGATDVEAAALRCVRIIRTVTREADTVARVHANLFAVLMPGISPGENLTGKLSRLIALGVMTDRDDPLSEPVSLKVAASSRSRFSGTAEQLGEVLRQKLLDETDSAARSIVYVSG